MASRFACWAVLLAAAAQVPAALPASSSSSASPPENRLGGPVLSEAAGEDHPEAPLRGEEQPCGSPAGSTHTCADLNGSGSFDDACVIASSSSLPGPAVCLHGAGSISIGPDVKIICPVPGCRLAFNVSGSIAVGDRAELVAGSVTLYVGGNVSLGAGAAVNATALAGEPPTQTSGMPHILEGAGGGHGGRGASCKVSNDTNWGGDVYAWASLDDPWSYGSKDGSLSADEQLRGDGGGRVFLRASEVLSVDGVVLAEGGVGSLRGGGGSTKIK